MWRLIFTSTPEMLKTPRLAALISSGLAGRATRTAYFGGQELLRSFFTAPLGTLLTAAAGSGTATGEQQREQRQEQPEARAGGRARAARCPMTPFDSW